MYLCSLTFSALVGYSLPSFLLDRIPHDNTANLLSKLKYRKGSASTVNKTGRGRDVGGVEEGDRRGVKSAKNQCHAPGARASKSKQQECEGNEWECKSCHSHGECFLFSPLSCTTYHINISQGMGKI